MFYFQCVSGWVFLFPDLEHGREAVVILKLVHTADSLEKTLMLEKIEGRRREKRATE